MEGFTQDMNKFSFKRPTPRSSELSSGSGRNGNEYLFAQAQAMLEHSRNNRPGEGLHFVKRQDRTASEVLNMNPPQTSRMRINAQSSSSSARTTSGNGHSETTTVNATVKRLAIALHKNTTGRGKLLILLGF